MPTFSPAAQKEFVYDKSFSSHVLLNVASRICISLSYLVVILVQAVRVSPDLNTVKSIMKIAWSASSCSFHLLHALYEDIHAAFDKVSSLHSFVLFVLKQILIVSFFSTPPGQLSSLLKERKMDGQINGWLVMIMGWIKNIIQYNSYYQTP